MAAELKPIDVICQPSRDGKITPMKIRVIDEDGEYQEYKIKGYNIIMRNNIGLNKKRILAARYATRPFSSAKAAEAGRHMHDAIPDAEERLSWGMPTFWKGRNIIHFAPAKKHI